MKVHRQFCNSFMWYGCLPSEKFPRRVYSVVRRKLHDKKYKKNWCGSCRMFWQYLQEKELLTSCVFTLCVLKMVKTLSWLILWAFYIKMPVNGSEHPVYHLKRIGTEPQGRAAIRDEALTQNNWQWSSWYFISKCLCMAVNLYVSCETSPSGSGTGVNYPWIKQLYTCKSYAINLPRDVLHMYKNT